MSLRSPPQQKLRDLEGSDLAFPHQLSARLAAEGHHLPIGNRHFDHEVQILVLVVLLVRRLLAVIVSNDPLLLSLLLLLLLPEVSLQEVHPRLHLRNELQLKVPDAEVPPGVRSVTS